MRGSSRGRAPVAGALFIVFSVAAVAAQPPRRTRTEAASDREAQEVEAPLVLPEVVVTARRIEEPLEDTPVAVTVLDAETLNDAGVSRLDRIQQLTPNLQFQTGRTGQTGTAFIRGVGQTNPDLTFDPGVGVYVDGVFLPRSFGQVLDLVDVDRIEVLRGPQGTLFGRNTVGGAINVVTAKPQPEPEVFGLVRAGTFDAVQTRATLNAPLPQLNQKVLARLSFASANGGGYTNNTFRDEDWSDENSLGTLVSLRFLPTDALTVDLSGTWSRNHARGRGGQCVAVQRPPDPGVAFLFDTYFPGYQDACRASRPFDFEADVHGIVDVESYGTWLTGEWRAGDTGLADDVALESITAWREQVPRVREDVDMTSLPLGRVSFTGGSNPYDGEPGFQRQISQELQLAGALLDRRIHLLSGLYGFWEEGKQLDVIRFFPDVPPADATGGTTRNDTRIDNWSYAVYGHATFDVTDWMTLSGGLRWTIERKGFSKFSVNPFATNDPSTLGDESVLVDANDAKTFDAFTPTATVSLLPPDSWLDALCLDDLLGYFRYARGFKSGGFNGDVRNQAAASLQPFDPEFLDSFELGIKTIALRERLTLNAALFLGNYDDIQVEEVALIQEPGQNLPQIERVIRNAAAATIRGFEAELSALPFAGASLTGSIGLLDAELDDFPDAENALTGEPLDRSGESFSRVPKLQTHLAAEYALPVHPPGPPWLAGQLTPRLDHYYQSRIHYLGPEVSASVQPGYNLLHARLGYAFDGGRAEVALFARNLTDETYFNEVLSFLTLSGALLRYYEPPRLWGGEVSYRF